jgi:hypothetical protein
MANVTALHNVNVFAAIVESKPTAIRNDTARGAFVRASNRGERFTPSSRVNPRRCSAAKPFPAAAKKFHNLGIADWRALRRFKRPSVFLLAAYRNANTLLPTGPESMLLALRSLFAF